MVTLKVSAGSAVPQTLVFATAVTVSVGVASYGGDDRTLDALVHDADLALYAAKKAGRVADFFELGELMCMDALHRNESCGGHFREEYQTPDHEALRKDDEYSYVAAWEFKGVGSRPLLHKERLHFEEVHPTQRSYK